MGGPRLIVFSGMDGAGKSAHAHALVGDLSARGQLAVYRRLRFPFVLSVPVLLYARLRGWGYDIPAEGQTLRAHGFEASPLMRFLYPITLFVDLLLATWLLIRLPMALGRTVVCDRFVLDSLIDVASSCKMEIAFDSPLSRLYRLLVPSRTATFLLTARDEVLLERRDESAFDPSFSFRSRLYKRAAEMGDVHVVESGMEFERVHETVLARLMNAAKVSPKAREPPQTMSRRWYALFKGGKLPSPVRNGVLLLTHWVFQSVGSMGRTERALKAAIGIAVFIPAFLTLTGPLGLVLAGVLAAFLAHTVNFLLNAHIPVVLKHVDLHVGRARLREYAGFLSARVRDRGYLEGAVLVGSLARDDLHANSDLDVRVIPKPGLTNAVRAGLFVLWERARALLMLFPLDIYVAENPQGLHGLRVSEKPRILSDNRGALRVAFPPIDHGESPD